MSKVCVMVPKMCDMVPKMCVMVPKMCVMVPKMCVIFSFFVKCVIQVATFKGGGRPSYMGDRLSDISCRQIFVMVLGSDKFPQITPFDC